MSLSPGTRLDHYEILSPIGKGGMGEVYRARDTRLGREVAIKTLPANLPRGGEHLARFRREARAASALNHPHICTIYDLSEHADTPFIVMELLKGETLGDLLVRGPVALDRAVDLGIQLADALEAAHAEGIIHRDIKPANIFVTTRGDAKILDFGVARIQHAAVEEVQTEAADFMTHGGGVIGTVAYMSPEQARGESLDATTDLFSLGVVLYEMTTGRMAFPGPTTAVIFNRILSSAVDPATAVNPALPKALDALFARLLAKERDRRYSSARELRADLQALKREPPSTVGQSRPAPEAPADKPSIVVLPFENLSADPDNEFFSDGLTDEIITDLSQIRTLRVISRNSSMQLKGARKDLKVLASELGVRYVLSGSVRKSPNAVRITAQLVDPVKDETLWAEKYTGTLEDIFDIQEQISRRIVDALKMQLSPKEDRKLAERRIDNVKAFECYVRSRQEMYKFTKEGLDQAMALIDTALTLVGDNELLYAAKGSVHWQYVNAAIRANARDIERAEECVTKVFALNPDSAAGHALLGQVRQAQGRPVEAIASFKRALALDPVNVYASGELGRVYGGLGRDRDSSAMMDLARREDPLSPIHHHGTLWNALLSGNPALVVREAPRVLQSVPEFAMVRWDLAVALIQEDRLDEARDVLAAAPAERVPTIAGRVCVALKLALEGRRTEALACIGEHLSTCAWNVEYWSWQVAECYAVAGAQDEALDWLENATRRGFVHYPLLSRSRTFRSLRGNPRFEQLSARVKATWEEMQRLPL
jgi:serine/threonine protein kinase/Tfp pilus assembly protein PilF